MDTKTIVVQKSKSFRNIVRLQQHEDEFVNNATLLDSVQQSKRKRSPDGEDSSPKRRFLEEEEEHDEECINGAVSVELISLNNSDQLTRRRSTDDEDPTSKHKCLALKREEEEDEYAKDLVFYKPWIDNKDPSSSSPSVDEYLALLLLNLSRGQQSQTQPQSQVDSYKCDVCGKSFNSYQALGGHKTSHRIKSTQVPFLENAETGDKTRSKILPSGKIHKCDVCHSVFPTGQALGGHKRRHYEGVIGISGGDKSSLDNNSVTTNVKDPKQSMRRLIIDLNEPALPEIDEDGGKEVREIER